MRVKWLSNAKHDEVVKYESSGEDEDELPFFRLENWNEERKMVILLVMNWICKNKNKNESRC